MGKDWGPNTTDARYNDKSSRSTAHAPYGWPHASQPNIACRVPSSACELRWMLEMVAAVEVVTVHLRLTAVAGPASAVVPVLACNTSQ